MKIYMYIKDRTEFHLCINRGKYFGHRCEELTHWKRPWCWERLKAGGEGDDRGWDNWVASPMWWTWVSANCGSWWWTGRPGVLQSMGSQSRTRLNDWTELKGGEDMGELPWMKRQSTEDLSGRGTTLWDSIMMDTWSYICPSPLNGQLEEWTLR